MGCVKTRRLLLRAFGATADISGLTRLTASRFVGVASYAQLLRLASLVLFKLSESCKCFRWACRNHDALNSSMRRVGSPSVRISRRFESSPIRGYVIEVGPTFFLLALVSDRLWFDGFECFRIADLKMVESRSLRQIFGGRSEEAERTETKEHRGQRSKHRVASYVGQSCLPSHHYPSRGNRLGGLPHRPRGWSRSRRAFTR